MISTYPPRAASEAATKGTSALGARCPTVQGSATSPSETSTKRTAVIRDMCPRGMFATAPLVGMPSCSRSVEMPRADRISRKTATAKTAHADDRCEEMDGPGRGTSSVQERRDAQDDEQERRVRGHGGGRAEARDAKVTEDPTNQGRASHGRDHRRARLCQAAHPGVVGHAKPRRIAHSRTPCCRVRMQSIHGPAESRVPSAGECAGSGILS